MTKLQMNIDREQLAADINDLQSVEPLPASALRLMNVCQELDVPSNEIISIIQSEPAIAARVLAVANSPVYGYSRRISTISHAVVILGIRNISQLALSFAARPAFSVFGKSNEFCAKLYSHSLGCGLLAGHLAEVCDIENSNHAYLAGLLHDIGKLVFVQLLRDDYVHLVTTTPHEQLVDVENDIFGLNHQSLGERCAEKWGFPLDIRKAIGNHHFDGKNVDFDSLTSLVGAANYIAKTQGIGSLSQRYESSPLQGIHMLDSISAEDFELLLELVRAEYQVLSEVR